ncbi:S9 family peptidase, partial [candidate division WOR-3 bacterium]|nr:S9 family peptidase [candidate division WOR-3 bacterium]
MIGMTYSNLAFGTTVFLVTKGHADDVPQPPKTPVMPVTETYHGAEVVDNYQWLENGDDPKVKQWSKAQNEYTRWVLDEIPVHEAIAKRLHELYNKASSQYYRFQYQHGALFALKDQPPLDQPLLIKLDSPYDLSTEQVILDPNQLDPTGLTPIDFYVVSPDARLVAVSLSKGGTENGDVHIYEVATGKKLPDIIPRVNGPTAGGDVAWTTHGSGFYYTR